MRRLHFGWLAWAATAVCWLPVLNSTAAPPPGYQLVWADEFDGARVNTEHWSYRTGKAHFSVCAPEHSTLENGCLKVRAAREAGHFTGGGLITKRQFFEGYYETRVKLDGGRGWHDAFWTTWLSSMEAAKTLPPEIKQQPRIEIDCLEHYPTFDAHKFSYGIIEWQPVKGNINRDFHEVPADLGADFHVYAFELTTNFCNFYFDDRLLHTTDLRGIGQIPFHLWLTGIATGSNAVPRNGGTQFDYLRCYQADAATTERRWREVLPQLDQSTGPTQSRGRDLWVEAEDFTQPAGWRVEREGAVVFLRGQDKPEKSHGPQMLTARTSIRIEQAGTYRLWVRGRDYAQNQPGRRKFAVTVNGVRARVEFGTHGQEGFGWQEGGTFTLGVGTANLELIDTSQYCARCDKLLLTTDLNFKPEKTGARGNATHQAQNR